MNESCTTAVGRRFVILAAVAMCAGDLLAYDTYYWVDSGDHDMAAVANWRLNSATGEVPATFPPTLDTATSGSTHPLLCMPTGSTLSLPNNDTLTVNWMSVQDANAECSINLGAASKILYLFGGGDASFWVGGNYPNGQKATLISGTLHAPKQHSSRRSPCESRSAGVFHRRRRRCPHRRHAGRS